MLFYTGIHKPSIAKYVDRAFISVNALRNRVSDFEVKDWILDSGAFTELSLYGKYRHGVKEYADLINRWCKCGNLKAAVCQDYMCEPFMLDKTGLTIREHQLLTIQRYDDLIQYTTSYIMPVLQGFRPDEYLEHLDMYGGRLKLNMIVGIGSVCKRNSNPGEIVDVLDIIRNNRPDLRLHGFGLKKTALANNYIESMLYSADSMAWSYAARREGRNANSGLEAGRFHSEINNILGTKNHQFILIPKKE